MDLRRVDLNLLPVLDALLRHQSVTLAAQELDMSQSALSSALARLRLMLGDELFVRTGRGVRPTARAAALAEPLTGILKRVRDAVMPGDLFKPDEARRQFRLCLSDVGSYVMWPRIVQAVRAQAPQVSLTLRLSTADATTLPQMLESGEVDLAIGAYPLLPRSLFQRRLYERKYVCLMHEKHALARRAPTIRQFAGAPQLVVRTSSGVQERIDQELGRQSLRRADTLEVPSYLLVPPFLETGRYLAVLPGQLADAFATHTGLVSMKLPMELPTSIIRLHWHRRFHEDAGNVWLRRLLIATLTG